MPTITKARINAVTDVPEHLHIPGPTFYDWHWASAGHVPPWQTAHQSHGVYIPAWESPSRPSSDQLELYANALAQKITWREPYRRELEALGRSLEDYKNGTFDYPV